MISGWKSPIVPIGRRVGTDARALLLGRFRPHTSRRGDDVFLRRGKFRRPGGRLHQFGARLVLGRRRTLRLQRKHAGKVAGQLFAGGLVRAIGRRTDAARDKQAGRDKRRNQRRACPKMFTHHMPVPLQPASSPAPDRNPNRYAAPVSDGNPATICLSRVCRYYLKQPSRATTGRNCWPVVASSAITQSFPNACNSCSTSASRAETSGNAASSPTSAV